MSGNYSRMGEGIVGLIEVLCGLLIFFIPLGMWKLVEIAIWCWHHIHIGVTP